MALDEIHNANAKVVAAHIARETESDRRALELLDGAALYLAARHGHLIAAQELYRWADYFATRDK